MSKPSKVAQYIDELDSQITDQIHKRLVAAYHGEDPKQSVEEELFNVLKEALENED